MSRQPMARVLFHSPAPLAVVATVTGHLRGIDPNQCRKPSPPMRHPTE
ncbi:MAG: hypothetical protein AAF399_25750 [Bacteroidota bacterium]